MKHIFPIFFILFLACVTSCENNDVGPRGKGSLTVRFDNRVGEADLVLNENYVNAGGETFQLTKLNYYISNIRLTKTDGSEFVVPQDSSYYLIMEDVVESHLARINNVPIGEYNKITFTIGVDSLRSAAELNKRTGVLNPAQGHDGMYWTWNSGYIFMKMEGVSPSAPTEQENKFFYHIGGYGGYDAPSLNNIRETTISMGSDRIQIQHNQASTVHLRVDVLDFFSNPTPFKIEDHPAVMFSEFSKTISANYVNMFKYDRVDQ